MDPFLPLCPSGPGTLGIIDQDQLQRRAITQVHNGGISPISVRGEIMQGGGDLVSRKSAGSRLTLS